MRTPSPGPRPCSDGPPRCRAVGSDVVDRVVAIGSEASAAGHLVNELGERDGPPVARSLAGRSLSQRDPQRGPANGPQSGGSLLHPARSSGPVKGQ